MNDKLNNVWTVKYMPKTKEDIAMPDDIKAVVFDESNCNLLLSGPPGCGKSTLASVVIIGKSVLKINASATNGIDTVRDAVTNFCNATSIEGKAKVVLLEEADGLTEQAQKALRAVMDTAQNVQFIMTCNYSSNLIEPLRNSRFFTIDFYTVNAREEYITRLCNILDCEKVSYSKSDVELIIDNCKSDLRRAITVAQVNSASGTLILARTATVFSNKFTDVLLGKLDNNEIYSLCINNEVTMDSITTALTEYLKEGNFINSNVGSMVNIINFYDAQHTIVSNKEVNTIACCIALKSISKVAL